MITKTDYKQTTISKSTSLKGVGLHTGKNVTLKFLPAGANFGYAFKRVDLEGEPIIKADASLVTSTQRGTCLEKNGVSIQTCEHVLAALVGLEIDNVIIELDSSEPPIMDGSSKFFIEALEKAGLKELDNFREVYVVKDVISYTDEDTGSEITIIPSEEYQVTTMVDFGTKVLGTQNANLTKLSNFKNEISNSRTFSFLHELEMLLEEGLIKGGDLNNAIVYVDKPLSKDTMEKLKIAFNKETIAVKPNGILDNLNLHYPNEAARHKLLDVVGDLALIGTRLKGKVIANKPGHYVNTQFAKKMSKIIKIEKRNNMPAVDLNQVPVMDVNAIMDMLPHRPPFLMIDKVFELSPNHVIGSKNVTMNEDFFKGHFPGVPVMPGVLIVEAFGQAAAALTAHGIDPKEYANKLVYLMGVDKARFRNPVIPDCELHLEIEAIRSHGRVWKYKGIAKVDGKRMADAEWSATIVDRKE